MLNNELSGNRDSAVRLLAQECQSGPLLRLRKGVTGPAHGLRGCVGRLVGNSHPSWE